MCCQIVLFAAIVFEMIERPWLSLAGNELPVSFSHRAVAVMAPPQLLFKRRSTIGECCEQALAMHRRRRLIVPGLHGVDLRNFKNRWRNVDQMNRLMTQLATGRNALGPVRNE